MLQHLVLLALLLACGRGAEPLGPEPTHVASELSKAEPAPSPTAPALRTVEIHVGRASGRPVVALHGWGDRPESFQGLFRGISGPSLLVLPAAPMPYGKGYTWFKSRLRSTPVAVIEEEIHAAVRRVVTLCAAVQQRTGHKPTLTGFSQGGVLAAAVAVQQPDVIALSVPLAGWLPPSMVPGSAPPGAVPIRALHGAEDEVLPLTEMHVAVEAMRQAGFDATIESYDGVEHGLSAEMKARLFALLSGGA